MPDLGSKTFVVGEVVEGWPTRTWNRLVNDMTQRAREGANVGVGIGPGRQVQAGEVYVRNMTAGLLPRDSVVGLGAALITRDGNEVDWRRYELYEGLSPLVANHSDKYAVLLDPIPANDIGLARMTGIVPVNVQWNDPQHKYFQILDSDPTKLESAPWGRAKLHAGYDFTGTELLKVELLPNVYDSPYRALSVGAVAAGGTGTFNVVDKNEAVVFQVQNVYHDWMDGGIEIEAGKECLISWFVHDQRARVIAAECNDPA